MSTTVIKGRMIEFTPEHAATTLEVQLVVKRGPRVAIVTDNRPPLYPDDRTQRHLMRSLVESGMLKRI
jgi:hypothetical protein